MLWRTLLSLRLWFSHGGEIGILRATPVRPDPLHRGPGVLRALLHRQGRLLRLLQLVVHPRSCEPRGHRLCRVPGLRGVRDPGAEGKSRSRVVQKDALRSVWMFSTVTMIYSLNLDWDGNSWKDIFFIYNLNRRTSFRFEPISHNLPLIYCTNVKSRCWLM